MSHCDLWSLAYCLMCRNSQSQRMWRLLKLQVLQYKTSSYHKVSLALNFQRYQTATYYPQFTLLLLLLFSCSVMSDSATPWTATLQGSLSFTISWSLLKLMSIESVMPSNYFILCRPFILLHTLIPSIRVFSSELTLHIRWPKYWSFSFSISPSNEYSELISFRIDWLNLLAIQGALKSLLQHYSSKASILRHSASFVIQLSPTIHDYWKKT